MFSLALLHRDSLSGLVRLALPSVVLSIEVPLLPLVALRRVVQAVDLTFTGSLAVRN
jgi:hypothetical protein